MALTQSFAGLKADIYASTLTNGTIIELLGENSYGDMDCILYRYDSSSMASDSFPDVIKPTSINPANPGRWLKIPRFETNPDWNAISGYSEIENKPTLFDGDYNSLSNTPDLSGLKRIETYVGSTNGSGIYTVTFGTAFPATPVIHAHIINPATNQFVRITAVSTTGFTIHCFQRNSINLLGTDVLLSSTANVNGASVNVTVIEQ